MLTANQHFHQKELAIVPTEPACSTDETSSVNLPVGRATGRLLFVILVIAALLRVGTAIYWQSRVVQDGPKLNFAFPDSESYWHLGQQLSDDKPYQFGSSDSKIFRAPGYPLILAALFSIAPNATPLTASFVNVFFGIITVGLVFWFAKLVFNARVGLIAALLCAIYPGAIGMSVFVLSEGAFCPLAILHLIFWMKSTREKCPSHAIYHSFLAGIFAALAILVRPSWLLFTPFAGVVLLLLAEHKIKTMVRVTVIGLTTCFVLTPWWIRNYGETAHFVPTTLQTGASLHDGLHEGADGSSDMRFVEVRRLEFVKLHIDKLDPQSKLAVQSLNDSAEAKKYFSRIRGMNREYEFDRFLKMKAIQWAKANPNRVASLAATKGIMYWSPWPTGRGIARLELKLVTLLGYLPLLILGVMGAWKFRSQAISYWLCLLPLCYFACLHMVFVSSIRYRQPAMLVFITLSAAAFCHFFCKSAVKTESNSTGVGR